MERGAQQMGTGRRGCLSGSGAPLWGVCVTMPGVPLNPSNLDSSASGHNVLMSPSVGEEARGSEELGTRVPSG